MLCRRSESSKSISKFSLEDIDSLITPQVVKKEALKATVISEPRTATTRAKSGAAKRKKPSELDSPFDMLIALCILDLDNLHL